MEPDALRRRLQREYFDASRFDPTKAHHSLDAMMRDVIVMTMNNRHVPVGIRENCRILRRAWDADFEEVEIDYTLAFPG